MTIPGMSSHGLPPNWDDLARRIKMLERKINDVRTAPTLENAAISSNGITVQAGGSIKFVNGDGDLLMTIDGTNGLVATALGLIGNASLAHPVSAFAANNDVDNLTPADDQFHTIATATIPVPDGVSAAAVTATAHAGATCTAGTGDTWLYTAARIGEDSGHVIAQYVFEGYGASGSASYASVLTNLGSSIDVQVRASVGTPANVAAGSLNGSVSALVMFYR